MAKVVLIGAGSTSFSPSVVADMARNSDLRGSTLSLVDVDEQVLDVVKRVAERIVEANGAELTVEAHTDRRAALPGADFVITTFAVGGAKAWDLDVEIPRRHGVFLPVGDTVGPGGLSRALRHVPLLVGVARDMEELCPTAYLFNYTNPLTALCRAVRKVTKVNVVGLCAGPALTLGQLADYLGLPADEVECHGAGINHLFWILDFRHEGRDVYRVARERLRNGDWPAIDRSEPPAPQRPWEYSEVHRLVPVEGQRPFCVELFDVLDYFPGPWDRHVTEFFPEFFPDGPMADHRYGLQNLPVSTIVERKGNLRGFLEEQADAATPLDPDLAGGRIGHSEEVVDVIASVVQNKGLRQFGNVPNRGLISNLPAEAVVEVPLTFGSYGWRAGHVGELPASVMPWMTKRVATIELFVDAALTGDRKIALQALLADGWVKSIPRAEKLLDELLRAQAKHLPQFA